MSTIVWIPFWLLMLTIVSFATYNATRKRKKMQLKEKLYIGSLWKDKKEPLRSELYIRVIAFEGLTGTVLFVHRDNETGEKIERMRTEEFLGKYIPMF